MIQALYVCYYYTIALLAWSDFRHIWLIKGIIKEFQLKTAKTGNHALSKGLHLFPFPVSMWQRSFSLEAKWLIRLQPKWKGNRIYSTSVVALLIRFAKMISVLCLFLRIQLQSMLNKRKQTRDEIENQSCSMLVAIMLM